jgi:hypothetical protein
MTSKAKPPKFKPGDRVVFGYDTYWVRGQIVAAHAASEARFEGPWYEIISNDHKRVAAWEHHVKLDLLQQLAAL